MRAAERIFMQWKTCMDQMRNGRQRTDIVGVGSKYCDGLDMRKKWKKRHLMKKIARSDMRDI